MLNLSKGEVKHQFLKGMAFANKVDGRSYAHVAGACTTWQGDQQVGSNPVNIRPTVMHQKKKRLSIASTSMSVSTVSLSKHYDRKNWETRAFKRTHDKVFQGDNIELKNRFQVLSSLDKVPVQFEDDALSGTSTVVTKNFPNSAAGKKSIFWS